VYTALYSHSNNDNNSIMMTVTASGGIVAELRHRDCSGQRPRRRVRLSAEPADLRERRVRHADEQEQAVECLTHAPTTDGCSFYVTSSTQTNMCYVRLISRISVCLCIAAVVARRRPRCDSGRVTAPRKRRHRLCKYYHYFTLRR